MEVFLTGKPLIGVKEPILPPTKCTWTATPRLAAVPAEYCGEIPLHSGAEGTASGSSVCGGQS